MNSESKLFYDQLNSLDENSSASEKRKRGRDFEKLLRMMLVENDLDPSLSYKPQGEEIDGSFILNDRVFLLEAKWHKESLPASSIYAFKGKVDGKLIGTIGIFISMSGYSDDAVDALSLGKSLNVILFDKEDIEASFESRISFRKILITKLRKAAERGLVYFPIKSTQLNYTKGESLLKAKEIETEKITNTEKFTIICEGKSDALILRSLIKKIIGNQNQNYELAIVTANGKYQVPKLGKGIYGLVDSQDRILYVVDGDERIKETQSLFLDQGIDLENVIIPNPSIEVWLGMREDQDYINFYRENRLRKMDPNGFSNIIDTIDIDELQSKNKEFKKFVRLIRSKIE